MKPLKTTQTKNVIDYVGKQLKTNPFVMGQSSTTNLYLQDIAASLAIIADYYLIKMQKEEK